jgi:hypothetical protein
VGIEKIRYTVLHETHKRQVEKVINTLKEGSEGLYKLPPYCSRNTDLLPVPPVFILKWLSTEGTGGKSGVTISPPPGYPRVKRAHAGPPTLPSMACT